MNPKESGFLFLIVHNTVSNFTKFLIYSHFFLFSFKLFFTLLTGQLCCAGIFDSQAFWKQKEQALDGEFVSMSRYRGNVIADRDSTVTQCDITATNGVVHAIDEVGIPA